MSTQPRPVTGAGVQRRRRAAVLRLPVLIVVPVLLVGAGVISGVVGSASVPPPAPVPAAVVAPAGAESSSWYCAGGGTTGLAATTLQLVNTTSKPVAGTITSVGSTGKTGVAAVTVPPHQQVEANPVSPATGTWVASRADLTAGGVAVSEVVHGPAGWAEAPCASATGARWYFPTGVTSSGSSQFVSLYNPTVSPAVVDLSFLTSGGLQQPQPFQGLVVPPGRLLVEDVGSYVQDQASVATEVLVRSGRLVAAQLQLRNGGGTTGLSLELGTLSPGPSWTLARSVNVAGGAVDLSVMNPGASAEHVSVTVQLPSGPVPPVTATVAGGSLYRLALAAQTRIPVGTGYLVRVTATGGRGVVVGRTVQAPGTASAARPTWGAGIATDDVLARGAAEWVLPAPGVVAGLPVPGAAVSGVNLAAPPSHAIHARISVALPTGMRSLGHVVTVPAGGSVVVSPGSHPHLPMVVRGAPGASVSEDAGPEAMVGVVTINGVPVPTGS